MLLSCLVAGNRSVIMTSLSSSFKSHKLKVLNVSHDQGELIKEVIDGNAEENRVFCSPPTKCEKETPSGK